MTRSSYAVPLALALGLCSTAGAEIVVLDNGRFLKTESYSVEGDSARIELESGGELVLPMLRIDRVLKDEIVSRREQAAVEEALAPKEPLYLGFAPEHRAPDTPFGDFIFSVAKRRNVNPSLVAAIVRAESAFDPSAVSVKGARGLMQIMPSTGKQLGVMANDLFDAEINIEAGVGYLGQLIERYSGDLPLILAAYNAGENAVARHNGVPPFRETQEYIRRIYSFLGVSPVSEPASGK